MARRRWTLKDADTLARNQHKPIELAPAPAFATGAYDRDNEGRWLWFETRDARQYDEARRIELRRGDLVSVLVETAARDFRTLDLSPYVDRRDEPMRVIHFTSAGLELRDGHGHTHSVEWGLGLRYKLVRRTPM